MQVNSLKIIKQGYYCNIINFQKTKNRAELINRSSLCFDFLRYILSFHMEAFLEHKPKVLRTSVRCVHWLWAHSPFTTLQELECLLVCESHAEIQEYYLKFLRFQFTTTKSLLILLLWKRWRTVWVVHESLKWSK